jgi:ribosome-associated toxin RatA of RatAB toxin-antitoxin module/CRP-like cAMP-binding protein
LELKRSVLLPYTVEDMFDLIEQAEHYPQFLPWCLGATILERSDDWVAARIEFSYLKVRFGFETRNSKHRPEWLRVRMVKGPFRNFHCDWAFTPLGALGCRVDFAMSFEVADGRLDSLAGPAAGAVSKSMVEAFVKRAAATLTEASAKEFAKTQVKPAAPVHTVAAEPLAALPLLVGGASVVETVPLRAGPPGADSTETTETAVTATPPSLLDALRACPLAQDLTPDQTEVLARVVHAETFPAGAMLAREGASDNHLYVITSGSLAVVKNAGTPDETLLLTLGVGEFAHELGFLDGAVRYASLVATGGAQVLVLEREGLESLVDSHPRIAFGVMRAIVRVVHRAQARMSMQTAELTNYIVKQHGRY